MAQPLSEAGETWIDYGVPGEKSSYRFTIADLSAANFTASMGALTTLFTNIAALLTGKPTSRRIVASGQEVTYTPVTDPLSQRENKWLVRYHDTSARKFTMELPTADLSLLDQDSEFLDMTGTEAAAFKTSFEAIAKSPSDQSAVVVDSIQFVGRRT